MKARGANEIVITLFLYNPCTARDYRRLEGVTLCVGLKEQVPSVFMLRFL